MKVTKRPVTLTVLGAALFLIAIIGGASVAAAAFIGLPIPAMADLAVAGATALLAFFTWQSVAKAGLMARETAAMARATKLANDLAEQNERLRFTDKEILHMVEPEVREALNNLEGDNRETAEAKAARLFNPENFKVAVNQRSEELRHYTFSVGVYDNLFDRISAYADAGIIDEKLFFSQFAQTVISVYLLLKQHVWENPRLNRSTRIARFATRAFLHYAETTEAFWLGDDELQVFARKAREFYPGVKTEDILTRAHAMYRQTWREVYGVTKPDENTNEDHDAGSEETS
jgi:hypothetical protein